MSTKRDLKVFLEEICDSPHYVKFEYESSEKFFVALKCKIDEDASREFFNQYVAEWINKFGKFTSSNWIVRNTFPKLVRMIYRKTYACHLASFNKSKSTNEKNSRNKNCLARIQFKIKKISRNTIKNDPMLKEKLNMNILIDYQHSHLLRDHENFNMLKCTSDVDEAILQYFNQGFGMTTAKHYHEIQLVNKYGDQDAEYLSNAAINPTARHFAYLTKKFKDKIVIRSVNALLAEKKTQLEGTGGTLIHAEDNEIVVIVTPFMKRVLLELGADVVIVDSTPIQQCVVTFFYAPSKIGALPIACAIHNSQEDAGYSQTFLTVKITLENNDYHRTFDPKLIVTNEVKDQKSAALLIFPNSKRLVMPFDICRKFWGWLTEDDQSFSRKKRHPIMVSFRQMLCGESHSAQRHYNELVISEHMTPNVREYINGVWMRGNEWDCDDLYKYCDQFVLESSVTFIKEFIAQRCRSFTACNIVDVLTNVLDAHFCRLVNTYVKDRQSFAFNTKFLSKIKDVLEYGSGIQKHSAFEYKVLSQHKTRRYISLRTDTLCCDCALGVKGHFCEHLCGVISCVDNEFKRLPTLTDQEKLLFAKLCGHDFVEEEEKNLKPVTEMEVKEDDEEEMKLKNEFSNDFIGGDEDDLMDGDKESTPSSGHEDGGGDASNGYYYLDVKNEPEAVRDDPLDEMFDDDDNIPLGESASKEIEQTPENFKANYEKALKDINSEFRRLNKLFKGNANKCNLSTMTRLTRELAKIRPVERVNLKNMTVELNDDDNNM